MASLNIGPLGRYPDVARGEWQYANIIGAQTAVLVAKGGGMVHTVVCGIAGTLAEFYDAATGAALTPANKIATVDIAAATRETETLDVSFSQGLRVVVTGAATCDLTVTFIGAQTVSPRNFGTLDWNPGR